MHRKTIFDWGHVWRNPRDPGSFIGDPITFPSEMKANHTSKDSFTINLGHNSHGDLGFWAKVIQLPIMAAAGTRWDNSASGAYKIPTMDTYSIEPAPEYVEKSVASVSAETLRAGSNLYMVTGVKIARGGEGSHGELQTFGASLQGGINPFGASLPVQVSEQLNYSKDAHYNQSFGSAGDFVFAYRIREIFYKRGILKTREYNKGAVLGDYSDSIPKIKQDLNLVIMEAGIGNEDVGRIGESYSFMDDDGENCKMIF